MSRSLLRRVAPLIRTRLLENQRVLLLSKSSLSSSSSSSPSSSVAAVAVASDESGPGSSFPSSSAPDGQEEIRMTESCIRRMKELCGKDEPNMKKMLRLSIETGGCSGFQYVFGLDDQKNPDDRVFEKDGVKLVVDNISYDFVKGSTVDYVEELIRSAFLVTSNPSAVGGCSCKSSFMVK